MASDALPPWDQMLAVFIGGAIGSLTRFVAGYAFGAWLGADFPWATLFVNVAGSAWMGWAGTLLTAKPTAMDPLLRLFLTTGFAGGFTTFSTFAFESWGLFQRGEPLLGWANILGNLIVGFVFAYVGIMIARAQGGI